MQVKDRVLEALEGHRGTYFSGEALAKELQVSRNAVWKAIRQLRDQGYPIHAVSNRGYSLAPDSPCSPPEHRPLPHRSRPAGGGPARGHLHESGFTPASGGGGP
ncbi:MAG: HTH domain-containing protein [Evtepia gabavorous]